MEKGLPELLRYKNQLQEYTQKFGLPFPSYHTVNEGFQHAPKFRSNVLVNGTTYSSGVTFPHRKEAEQDAAKSALQCIKEKMKDEGHFSIIDKDPKCSKSILHEYAVRMNLRPPKYTTIRGEELRQVFVSSLLFNGKTYTGEVCASKKEAEQMAARAVIQTLLGSDSGVLRQIINSKVKICNALHKVRSSSFKQSNLSIIQKSVESSLQLINVRPSAAASNSMVQVISRLEKGKSGEKNVQSQRQ